MKDKYRHITKGTLAKPREVLLIYENIVNHSDYELMVYVWYKIKENSYILTYSIFDHDYSFEIPNMSILIDFFNKANTIIDNKNSIETQSDLSVNVSIYLRDNYSKYWIADNSCLLSTIEELHKMVNINWLHIWSLYPNSHEHPDYIDRSTPFDKGRDYLYDLMYKKRIRDIKIGVDMGDEYYNDMVSKIDELSRYYFDIEYLDINKKNDNT